MPRAIHQTVAIHLKQSLPIENTTTIIDFFTSDIDNWYHYSMGHF